MPANAQEANPLSGTHEQKALNAAATTSTFGYANAQAEAAALEAAHLTREAQGALQAYMRMRPT